MPLFRLSNALQFPPPRLAEPDGLLAIGGDLAPPRLLLAYSMGIFPWSNPGDPLLWWSPDPRCVFLPGGMHLGRSLRRELRRGSWRVSLDRAFPAVIEACAAGRRAGPGTWLSMEMIAAYRELHRLGFAHSVEVWRDGELVGGLYGICLGRCFFGESMFHLRPNASKVALAVLAATLFAAGFRLIDCQLPNPHLLSLGAELLPRSAFLEELRLGGVVPDTSPPLPDFPGEPHETETPAAP